MCDNNRDPLTRHCTTHFGGGKQIPKKITPRKKVALELLHHRLGHISTRSLMAVDIANVWKYIQLRIYSDPF